MSPAQAVQKIRSQGLVSFERTWTLGHSIAVTHASDHPAFDTRSPRLIYLYPSGDQWRVIDFSHPAIDDITCDTLDEAVDKAIAHLKPPTA